MKDRGGKKVTMAVNKLLDVEEHVWSPTYGLKGNIDATVQVEMQDEAGKRTLTVPFEVKTGRNVNQSHRAQTALYTLLLSDRYGKLPSRITMSELTYVLKMSMLRMAFSITWRRRTPHAFQACDKSLCT